MPLFTFLAWTTQIVSHFDFEKECFLDKLLLRLAIEYPTAVIYSFRLAYHQALDRKSAVRSVVQQILDAIKNPMLERFIENAMCLSLPEKVMEYHLKIVKSKPHAISKNRRELQICYDNVFGNVREKSSAEVEKFKHSLEELMEMNGSFYTQNAVEQRLFLHEHSVHFVKFLFSRSRQNSQNCRRFTQRTGWSEIQSDTIN